MNLIMISVSALLAMWTLEFWHLVRERELTSEILAIRDELRWLAIGDRAFRDSEAFTRFDANLASCARNIDCFSIWTLLPVLVLSRPSEESHREHAADLCQKREARELYERYGQVFVYHLRSRHIFIWAAAKVLAFAKPAWDLQKRILVAAAMSNPAREAMSSHRGIAA